MDLVAHGTFVEPRGIYIRSSVEVSVYVSIFFAYYGDTYLALPIQSIGQTYTIVTHETSKTAYDTNFLVVAAEDDTNVTVTFFNETTKEVQMNRLDCFQQALHRDDLSGTKVTSDKPVSVIVGSECMFYPQSFNCEKTMVQLLSSEFWTNQFILPRLDANDSLYDLSNDLVRVFSMEQQENKICFNFDNSTKCDSISSSDMFIEESLDNETVSLIGNISLQVIEFSENEIKADPFMTLLPGVSQYLDDYSFVIPAIYDELNNYVALIAVDTELENVLLDNMTLPEPEREYTVPEPFSEYSVTIYNITVDYHRLVNTNGSPFGAICFGTEDAINYGFPAGIRLANSNIPSFLRSSLHSCF